MHQEISLAQLQAHLHTALKTWPAIGQADTPLADLQLCRQALAGGAASPRQAVNQVLLEALQVLAAEQPLEAKLLRKRFLDGLVMHVVANQLNLGESTAYRRQQQALKRLGHIVQAMEQRARSRAQAALEKRLELRSESRLFGIEPHVEALQPVLGSLEPPWLVSIEGLGGIGKTALANRLIRRPTVTAPFHTLAWISAKQQSFLPGQGLEPSGGPALTTAALVAGLLEQLGPPDVPARSPQEQRLILSRLLKQQPHLVVIDNLETIEDYQTLLPLLRELANPSKFLLTSRHSLQAHGDVYCRRLAEISPADAFDFIRHEARLRGLSPLAEASSTELERIYHVVGGNPLALKLVIGQLSMLPLWQVLNNLREARGKKVDELYSYIYWQAWHMLSPASRQALLVMPLAQGGTLAQLLALSRLEPAELSQALEQLTTLSLVQISGELDERRYSIHRLTETFLLEEAVKWQPSL